MVNKHVWAIWKFKWIRKYNDKCKWIYNLKNKKLNKLSDLGINPYPYNYDFNKKTYTREICDNIDESKIFSLAGRIMFLRRMGNATFANIVDERGNIQVFFSKKLIGIENYDIFVNSNLKMHKCLIVKHFIIKCTKFPTWYIKRSAPFTLRGI